MDKSEPLPDAHSSGLEQDDAAVDAVAFNLFAIWLQGSILLATVVEATEIAPLTLHVHNSLDVYSRHKQYQTIRNNRMFCYDSRHMSSSVEAWTRTTS